MNTHDSRGGPVWWSALPDTDAAAPAVTRLREHGAQILVQHRSGRPWLTGTVPTGQVRWRDVPGARIAVIGDLLASDALLDVGVAELLRAPGSFHLAVSGPGWMSGYGDIAGVRALFTTELRGMTVFGSHARPLARLIGAGLDRTWLAMRLASPQAPSVLLDAHSPFVGVTPVPAAHRVITWPDAEPDIASFWTPPAATASLGEASDALNIALTTAVADRIRQTDGQVSVQLSGGMDSTALTLLADRAGPAGLLLVTACSVSLANDDPQWARRVAAATPDAEHLLLQARTLPGFFDGLPEAMPLLDEPAGFAAGAARHAHVARLLAEAGTRLHFNGQGGDEVLLAPLAYLGGHLRRRPIDGWRRLRGHAALHGLPSRRLARAVLTGGSYTDWLRHAAGHLTGPSDPAALLAGWEAEPRLPSWAAPDAVETLSAALNTAADRVVEPADRLLHHTMVRIRASARRASSYAQAHALHGVNTALPFLDRAVIEACLTARPDLRNNPWIPKLLLRAAFGPIAPEGLLGRRTKGHYNADIYASWHRHRDHIADLLDRPLLAEHGLIDTARLRRAVHTFGPSGLPPALLTETLATELWLRALTEDS